MKVRKTKKKSMVIISLLVVIIIGVGFYSFDKFSEIKEAEHSVFFVVHGEASVKGDVLTVSPDSVEWVTDRPYHRVGKISISELEGTWDEVYKDSSPNAAIATENNEDVIIEVTRIYPRGDEIDFEYKTLLGNLQEGNLGNISLFVDKAVYYPTKQVCEVYDTSGC